MTQKIHCSRCLQKTHHDLHWETKTTEKDECVDSEAGYWYAEGYNYSVFECKGCSNVVMRKQLWSSEIHSAEDWSDSYESWHPPFISRQKPDWLHLTPAKQSRILDEIYVALHAGLNTLVMMGLRTVFDQYLVEKVGDVGGFERKLQELVTQKKISEAQKKSLETAISGGDASAHRSYVPSREAINFAFELAELLLHQDVLAAATPSVAREIPQRPPRTKTP